MKRVVPTTFPAPLLITPEDLGAAIRAARTHSGFTLVDAAMHCGISKQTMQNIETGSGNVSLATALSAAYLFSVALICMPKSESSGALWDLDQSRKKAASEALMDEEYP